MIDALISGRLHGAPQSRTSKNGTAFATAVVRTATRDGNAIFCNVITFDAKAVTALLGLSEGDSVALAGELTPKVYQPPNGEPRSSLDLLAHAVLTEYHVARKRKAIQEPEGREDAPFNDELPQTRRGAR
jgi:single-stranded DNA-binding protein